MYVMASYNGVQKDMRVDSYTYFQPREVITMDRKTVTVARSAITGKFVKLATAVRDPRTTVIQTIKKGK